MFEKIKKLFSKFNKKENEQDIDKKKKNKIYLVAAIALILLMTLVIYDSFKDAVPLGNGNESSSQGGNNIIQLEENFIVEDLEFDKVLKNESSNSILHDGYIAISKSLNTDLNIYYDLNLKVLNEVNFTLDKSVYVYNDENYDYQYNNETFTLKVLKDDKEVLNYTNTNNQVTIKIDDNKIEYEVGLLSYTLNNETYELSLNSKELVIAYQFELNEYVEHYSKYTCSLIDIEFMEEDHLYHHFVLEEIHGNKEIKKDEETGEYYVYSSGSEEGEPSTNIDLDTMTLNYAIIDSYTVSIDNQETPILMLKIRDDYLSENGLPFGFK